MIDVLNKLREIEHMSPEVTRAIETASKMQVKESVNINLTGSDAVLNQILKLAGLIGAEVSDAGPSMGAEPAMAMEPAMEPAMGHHDMDHDIELELPEDDGPRPWASSPDEVVLDFDTAIPAGDDLHAAKGTYPKVAGGDNPMQAAKTF